MGLYDTVKKGGHKAVVITTASACSRMLFRLFKTDGIKTIAVVRKDDQKQLCLDNGATYALNLTDGDFEANLKKLASENGATCCIECIIGDVFDKIVRNLPMRSEVIFYGKLDESPDMKVNALTLLF